MDNTLQILITAATSSGVMSIILYLLQRRDRKKDEQSKNTSSTAKMLTGLAHDRILYLTERYIRRGAITSKEKTNLKYLYEPYHELGGNGDCETGYEVCKHLKVVSEDVSNKLDIRVRRRELGLSHEHGNFTYQEEKDYAKEDETWDDD